MKSKWKNRLPANPCWFLIALAILPVSSCNRGAQENRQVHPTDTAGDDLHTLLQPVSSTIVSGIRTISPIQKEMEMETEAAGTIAYDTRRAHTVPIRFSGRIERLYVHYNFEPVRKGQKLLEIYSPEIVTAQKELLYLMESDPGNTALIGAARQKLSLLGLSRAQIGRLVETGEESYSLAVYSPYSGYIYQESAAPASQAMASLAPQPAQTPPDSRASQFSIREGTYLETGQTAFKIINTDRVWAEFFIYPETVPTLKKGDSLHILPDFIPELAVAAKVDFLEPFFKEGEAFSKVRVYLDNPEGRFKPGQLVTARFQKRTGRTWWIPASAVLDMGTKKVVFRKKQQAFHPAQVQTGRIAAGFTEIISGLSPADTIAYEAHYMVDSEGFIKQYHE